MSDNTATLEAYTTGLLSKDLPTEGTRLHLLEKSYDPATVRVLQQLEIAPTWRCLELGAGAGSIAYWLADRVPQGSVVAADIDPRFLDADRAPQLTVRRMDVNEEDFAPGSFDLVHARAVFMHLPRREEVLRRAVRWLAPGGWLVLEDVYFLPAEDSPYPEWQRVQRAWLDALAAQGIDLAWARRAPASLAAAGLTSVGVSVAPGGLGIDAVQDELLRIRLVQSGRSLIEAGLATEEQMARASALVESVPAPDVSTFIYSSWGRQPAD
ncbi:class I SAM-dependent methyltransferase [Streptomyces cahuitamycinicus]|uniref:Ubiquinone biosynthesis methyltransferase UbiE n=1 Tax=Streptomyces cahuitamycinicus TaxID=2070367 RepID=A0A2N8TLX0_9ACTN|nr:class I SAM-dependent methyltransferase [Streptomyces cahuitamycinicus]PNG20021.1 ubiquinone biosynthesis methyltransferase UbiE [Streptomyces cahuitamycinicus]